MVWIVIVLAFLALLVGVAAWNDVVWRRRGFRTEIRGKGRGKQKVRIRLDPDAPIPEDPNLIDQDWVRTRKYDDDEPEPRP